MRTLMMLHEGSWSFNARIEMTSFDLRSRDDGYKIPVNKEAVHTRDYPL